jgi:hypothetical protein
MAPVEPVMPMMRRRIPLLTVRSCKLRPIDSAAFRQEFATPNFSIAHINQHVIIDGSLNGRHHL